MQIPSSSAHRPWTSLSSSPKFSEICAVSWTGHKVKADLMTVSCDLRGLHASVQGVLALAASFLKDTNGTFSWLCRKCVTAMGQLLIHVHSSMRRPTLVCTLLPWKQKTGQEEGEQLLLSTTEAANRSVLHIWNSLLYLKDPEFRGKSTRNKMFKIILMKNVTKQVVILFKGASWNLYFADDQGIPRLITIVIMGW